MYNCTEGIILCAATNKLTVATCREAKHDSLIIKCYNMCVGDIHGITVYSISLHVCYNIGSACHGVVEWTP